jgi:hypothetical protein
VAAAIERLNLASCHRFDWPESPEFANFTELGFSSQLPDSFDLMVAKFTSQAEV